MEEYRIEADSPFLRSLQQQWEETVRSSFAQLPNLTREDLTPVDV